MDIKEITDTLDKISISPSNYEFENFFLESFHTPARQLLAVMARIEELHADKVDISEKLAGDTTIGEKIKLNRQLSTVQQEYNKLVSWYEKITPEERALMLENFEEQEQEHWSTQLGRQAAIEILTVGRTTPETMDKMANLPMSSFEDAVRVCVRYAQLIRDTTSNIESSLGITGLDFS